MKAAVLHVNTSTRESTSPTMRIARFVSDELSVPLICSVDSARQHLREKFDVLFVKYGMLKFSNHRDEALEIYNNAKRVVNLENDYTMVPDKRFRQADEVWSTVEGKTRYVNWNVLTRRPIEDWLTPGDLPVPCHEGIIYYGAHREDRVPSFRRYFGNAQYPVTVSTFRGREKFEAYGKQVRVIGAFRGPDDAGDWQATVYAEDERSHSLYCSPATRFYECTMTGIAQFIDLQSANTLRKAGVKVLDRWVVEGAASLKSALRRWESVQLDQRVHWFRDYGAELRSQFEKARRESFG
jgi:hypothetical protein